MKINHKFNFVIGAFDTNKGNITCVTSKKYAEVDLCFNANMLIPFAKIKLYSGNTFHNAEQVLDDARNLGEEIEKRWNTYNEILNTLKGITLLMKTHPDYQSGENAELIHYVGLAEDVIEKALGSCDNKKKLFTDNEIAKV